MKIFVFEYVTGGGCAGIPLPPIHVEGETMWRALVHDLTAIEGVEVISPRDTRLEAPSIPGLTLVPTGPDSFDADFQACLAAADAVWLIAPESGGILESLSRDVLAAGKRLLGSHPDTVRITASKRATSQLLAAQDIGVTTTYDHPAQMTEARPVVAKPDDGAGCEETLWFANPGAAEAWRQRRDAHGFAYQYYLPGAALSMCLLCRAGQVQLLSVNRQHVDIDGGCFQFNGVTVNALADEDGTFSRLAQRIAQALPDLWGYVGVDLIAAEDGLTVVEVNPRVSVSYAGLARAIGDNPARRVLNLPEFSPCHPREPVHVPTLHAQLRDTVKEASAEDAAA